MPNGVDQPWTRYRPARTGTGGAFTEALANPITVWGAMEIHKDRLEMEIDGQEDVRIGDIMTIRDKV